ncbi:MULTISPECIES: aminotransferase class III-fold pyridoxal phosphate-dependent enzyme [unclassified Streptomyces]|uniref:aminotransferase class III-fold pyridoxal phosphate-dependent enzyme n=1 Tax=unclassified Streptomyces TaxID=2593676 RepID=UPI00036E09B0|nr:MULTISPECIES: aminotransferase class III-fold pyridoxal phosphate-dependent enzyme [unclassified Streptomyces]MYT29974.1 aminotransferase class III-fold pyridoxal phosphate-dependent enzyme [Streptomyces sp. SID8354]
MSDSVLLSARQPLPPIDYSHAAGAWIHTADGDRLLDAASGLICVNIGHAHPHVVEQIARQARTATFASPGALLPHMQEELALRLTEAVNRPGDKVSLSCSGTSAVELAISYARLIQRSRGQDGRHHILTARLGYHGNSALTLGLSGHRRRRPHPDDTLGLAPTFDPPYPGHHHNCPHLRCQATCADTVAEAIDRLGAESVAAVLIEPVNGTTGGAYVPPPGYLAALRRACHDLGVLVIHDEVLTGLGRTGLPLGADHCADAAADIVVLSKGLSAGYVPLSAVLVNPAGVDQLRSSPRPLPLMGTMSATPLQAAAGLAVLDVLAELGALDPTRVRGQDVTAAVQAVQGLPVVRETRGLGYFHAVELEPGTQAAALTAARDERLLLYPFNGFHTDGTGEGLIVAPPLNSSPSEVDFLAHGLHRALQRASSRSTVPHHR